MRPTPLYVVALAGLALATSGCGDNRPTGPGARDAGSSSAVDTYGSCRLPGDCFDPVDQCLELSILAEGTYGAFCSSGCSSDADCVPRGGFDGACYSLDGSAAICFQRCNFDSDCPSSSVCIPVDLGGGTDFICVPNNG